MFTYDMCMALCTMNNLCLTTFIPYNWPFMLLCLQKFMQMAPVLIGYPILCSKSSPILYIASAWMGKAHQLLAEQANTWKWVGFHKKQCIHNWLLLDLICHILTVNLNQVNHVYTKTTKMDSQEKVIFNETGFLLWLNSQNHLKGSLFYGSGD